MWTTLKKGYSRINFRYLLLDPYYSILKQCYRGEQEERKEERGQKSASPHQESIKFKLPNIIDNRYRRCMYQKEKKAERDV